VPEARGRFPVAEVTGPRKPRVSWNVALPFAPPGIIRAIGVDGTVYVNGYDGLAAAREGKLIWAFHARNPRVTLVDDGRIWFPAPGSSGYFCLNRAGQGGFLPPSYRCHPTPASRPSSAAAETANG